MPSVTIDSTSLAAYRKVPPGGEDIGLAYLEVPLADLAGNLNVSVDFPIPFAYSLGYVFRLNSNYNRLSSRQCHIENLDL